MNVMTNVVIDCGIFERVKISPTESQNRVMKGDLLFNGHPKHLKKSLCVQCLQQKSPTCS